MKYVLILKTKELTSTVMHVMMKRKRIICIFHIQLPDELTQVWDEYFFTSMSCFQGARTSLNTNDYVLIS